MLLNAVFWIILLIFCFSLLKYTYYYNYRSHISLQVAKLVKSAAGQIRIFPTVCTVHYRLFLSAYLQAQLSVSVCRRVHSPCVWICVYSDVCVCVNFPLLSGLCSLSSSPLLSSPLLFSPPAFSSL